MNQVNLADFARRLIWLRKRRGLTQEELAERCRTARTRLFPPEWLPRVPHIRRDRIAKIELAASSSANGARSISDNEIRLLAAALDVPETWLRGSTNGCDAVWDYNIEPARARAIADLIAFHEEHSNERWAWTRVLPCSLQPPEFLRRYAKIWASSILRGTVGYQHRERVAESLLLIGEANRERTLSLMAAKKLKFFVALPTNTIKSIARGSEIYAGIAPSLRLSCLRELVRLVEGFQETLHLVLVDRATMGGMPRWLAPYEAVYASGGLAAWNDYGGIRYLSESPNVVQTIRERVQATFARARYKRHEEVLAFLRHEMDALATALARRRTKPSTHRPVVSPGHRLRTSTVGQVALEKTRTANLVAR